MRNIEQEMIEAIDKFKYYRKDNTEIRIMEDSGVKKFWIYLFGNLIATIDQQVSGTVDLFIRDCGHQTKTTKSRLNAILSHFGLPTIGAKKFQWYIGDEKWVGTKTFEINA